MSKLIVIILIHVLGDSILLGKRLRKLKINSIPLQLKHVGIYTSLFLFLSPFLLGLTIKQSIVYSLLNAVLHFIVDYLFTKVKVKYWTNKQYIFIVIYSGLEHFVHVSILIATFLYMFPNAVDISNWSRVLLYYFIEKPI